MKKIERVLGVWAGEGSIELAGETHRVVYEIESRGNSNTFKVVGSLKGIPAASVIPLPQDDRIPLTLKNGHVVGVAILNSFPCNIIVNTSMPDSD